MVINKLKHSYVSKVDGEQKNTSFFVVGQTIHDLDTNWCCQLPSDRGRMMMAIGSTIGKAMGSNLIQPPCTDIVYAFPKASMLPEATARDEWLEGCRLIVLNIEYLTACRPCCPRCRKKNVESKGWDVQSSRVQLGEVHTTFVVFREWQCKNPACKKGKFKETNEDLINELPQPLSSLIRHRLRPLAKNARDDDPWTDGYTAFELGLMQMAKHSVQHSVPGAVWPPHTPSIPNTLAQVSPSPDSVLPDSIANMVSAGSTSPEGSGHALGPPDIHTVTTLPPTIAIKAPPATAATPLTTATPEPNAPTTALACIASSGLVVKPANVSTDSDMADAALALQALSQCLMQPGHAAAQPTAASWATWQNVLHAAGTSLTVAPNPHAANHSLTSTAIVAPSPASMTAAATPADTPIGGMLAASTPPAPNRNASVGGSLPSMETLILPHSDLQLRRPPQPMLPPAAPQPEAPQHAMTDPMPLKPLSQNARLGVSHGAVQKVTSKQPHSGLVHRHPPISTGRVPSTSMITGVIPSHGDAHMSTPTYAMGTPCDLHGHTQQLPQPCTAMSLPAHCGAAAAAGNVYNASALTGTDWLAAMAPSSAMAGLLMPPSSGLMLRPSHEASTHAASYLYNMCLGAPHLWGAQPVLPVRDDLPCPR